MYGMHGLMIPKPKPVSIDEFLKRMPLIVGQPDRMGVLMTSYNGIIGVREGEYPGMLGGRLDLTVHVGDNEVLMAASGGLGNAQKAQALIERKTRFDGRLYDLAIVYIGSSVFERGLQFAHGLARSDKAQRVVVLTCDCNLEEKRKAIKPLLESGELAAAVWTKECGGSGDMRAILDRLEQSLAPEAQ